ncbi:MAG: retropepsin-like aspartic protease [Bacteroidota bacterium]|nr:retropepsin-like aspartic protease [Bacteroidota bacterium]MEC8090356.1 retropepsin-like aspartic protease [Bacteroidota bacterium]MEC8238862.1 retropepsin-like aspartic protease [Bacteroidota bacterium]
MNTLYQFLRSRGYTRARLLTLPTNHYVVIATLNGTAGRFILDTGASTTCVSTELATHFHLNPKPSEEKASSASANELDTKVAHHNELMIGSWSSKRRSVVLFDMQAVNHALQKHNIEAVDGIIGADILQSVNAIIDYKNDWLYLR